MADQVQFRGGTTAQHATFTGAVRELSVDTDKAVVVVHDGATPGGHPMLRQDLDNLPPGSVLADLLALNVLDPQAIYKPSYDAVAFVKTGPQAISLKAGTTFMVDGALRTWTVDTVVALPALVAGTDYSIWAKPDGSFQAIADPFTSPAAPPTAGARKVGGFHYGLVAPGTTVAGGAFASSGFTNTGGNLIWNQAAVDRIAGINEFSIWDLAWCCAGEQQGMTLDPQTQTWWGIYFCSSNHIANGISKYNTDVASGTVFPRIPLAYGGNGATNYGRLSFYEAQEIVSSHGLRLPRYEEFNSAAAGVTENQSLGGTAVTIPATARQPGYTSRIGIEQATGHQWIFGGPLSSSGGTAYQTDPGRGSFYGTTGLPLYGGSRGNAADSGSRAAIFSYVPWGSTWVVSVRAAGDHLKHGVATR